ncbi:MAG: peptidoglycan DD-metalloendopeptidase family protein, partial [Flavobacteriales bacterium]
CVLLIVFVVTSVSCVQSKENAKELPTSGNVNSTIGDQLVEPEAWELAFRESKGMHSLHFEFPVGEGGKSTPMGYYNAQGFQENNHLGDDWNGTGGGNSDLGDPVYVVSKGWVRRADDLKGGWGKVVRIVHLMIENGDSSYVESVYAHLDSIDVEAHTFVDLQQKIGTIGNADGAYLAHLHLEIRKEAGLPIGGGYSTDTTLHYNPSSFIKNH